jgi:hypothetical protein
MPSQSFPGMNADSFNVANPHPDFPARSTNRPKQQNSKRFDTLSLLAIKKQKVYLVVLVFTDKKGVKSKS